MHRSFKKLGIANPIIVAKDGLDALNILRGTGGQEKLAHPYIILLDINMPRMNGIEFLDALRKDAELHASIVFILTTSNDEQDRLKAYAHHVAGYILKSKAGESFIEAVKMLKEYWTLVELPARQER